MLRRTLMLLPLIATVGCGFGSLMPFVEEKDAVFDQALVGTWLDTAEKDYAVISAAAPKNGARAYHVLMVESNGRDSTEYIARLGQFGAQRVLDVVVAPSGTVNEYPVLLVPLHVPLFLDAIGSTLRYHMLEPDSIKRYLKAKPGATMHRMVGDDSTIVLTGTTRDVRAFVLDFVRRKGVSTDTVSLVRRSP